MSIIGKQFLLKDSFDFESLQMSEILPGRTQEFFGFEWTIYAVRSNSHNGMPTPENYQFGVGSKEQKNPNDWTVDIEFESNITKIKLNESFKKHDSLFVCFDVLFQENKEQFMIDGQINVEYRVTIKKVTGFPDFESFENSKVEEEKVASVVGKLEEMSLKSGEAALTFEKWNCLTDDLKLYCIGKMNFKTRFLLRGTSRTERRLVNSQRFAIDDFSIEDFSDGFALSLKAKNERREIYLKGSDEPEYLSNTYYPLAAFILKKGNIQRFESHFFPDLNSKIGSSLFDKNTVFNVENLIFCGENRKQQISFIEKCRKNSVKRFETDEKEHGSRFPFDDYKNLPGLGALDLLFINGVQNVDLVVKVTNHWIENEMEVGKQFKFTTSAPGFLQSFASEFQNRIVHMIPEKEVRIGMTSQKHIILNIDRIFMMGVRYYFFVLVIVPPKMSPEEHQKFTKFNN